MATMTLTEFNRYPSRATGIARIEDVIVTDHGTPTWELRRLGPPTSRLDRLRRSGALQPVRDCSGGTFPDFGLDGPTADRLYAAFASERDERGY